MSCVADHTAILKLSNRSMWMPRNSSTSRTLPWPVLPSRTVHESTHRQLSFIPDPTSLYNMRVDELLKENLGHMRHFFLETQIGASPYTFTRRGNCENCSAKEGVLRWPMRDLRKVPKTDKLGHSDNPSLFPFLGSARTRSHACSCEIMSTHKSVCSL